MFHYRIDLSYVGTCFSGWQSQPNGNTVQDFLENALARVLGGRVRLVGASRTDAGVHAEHQVALFQWKASLDLCKLSRSLSALVPEQIGIKQVRLVDANFHPILKAHGKIYRYRWWMSPLRNPFFDPYCWQVPGILDVAAMIRAYTFLHGQHDFSAFCAADSSAKRKVRTIYDMFLNLQGPLLDFWIIGDGFLKQMIRAIAGTLADVGRGAMMPDQVNKILLSGDRKRAGRTAPANGLSLVEVFYDHCPSIKDFLASKQFQYTISISEDIPALI